MRHHCIIDMIRRAGSFCLLALATSAYAQNDLFDSGGMSADEEIAKLTAVLESDAPPFEKTLACKRLAIVGDTRFEHAVGRGISHATLSDRQGVFAAATASQLVQPVRG